MLGSAHPTRPAVLARWGLAVSLAAAAFVVAVPAPAHAATTLTVSTTADSSQSSGACANPAIVTPPVPLTLRAATCLADNIGGAVTITIPAGTYTLTGGDLESGATAGQNVTFVGAGSASTIIDAGGASRVFNLDPGLVGGITTGISGVTITGGADSTYGGAGIIGGSLGLPDLDSLTLTNVAVTDNHANGTALSSTNQPGGGVQFLGGSLTVTGSTFSQNTSQSSSGSAIAYEADPGTPSGRLSIDGTTFQGNSTSNASSAAIANGGAVSLRGYAGATSTITNSRFIGNTATSTTGPAVGAAIWSQSGDLAVSSSTFTGNTVSGGAGAPTGGAIEVEGGTAAIDHSRFVGNTAFAGGALGVKNGATVTAAENWWGCNAGPGSSGCDSVSGPATTTPRLQFAASADPSTITGPDGAATISGLMTVDSAGAAVPPSALGAFTGLLTSFSDPAGDATVGGSAGAKTSTMTSGAASIAYDSNTISGPSSVDVTFDNQTVTANLTVLQPLAITSADSATFKVGAASSFTVTTSGFPVTSISTTSPLPNGVQLTFNPATGTATLAGTPVAGTAGTYAIALAASNGAGGTTTQDFTLTVGDVPTFTSSATATFTAGTAGTFAITTSGTPTVTAVTQTGGTLPTGLTLTLGTSGATLSGTPAAGTGGSYPITLSASNGVLPNATQTLTIQVNEAPAITTNPVGLTVEPGGTATFTAAASGTPAPTVQWQRNTGSGFANIGGATSTTYSFTSASGDNGTTYRAVFTNTVSSATTTAATLRVGSGPAFTSAASATFAVGTAGSFAVTTAGTPTPTSITQTAGVLPTGLTLVQDPLGGSTATLSGTPAAGTAGTYTVTLTASNGFVPDATQTLTIQVNEAPVITTQPTDQTVVSGDVATFTAAATGAPAPTVQWQQQVGGVFTDIAGATSTTYSITTTDADDLTVVRAVFTNTAGTATSDPATLHLGVVPTFSSPDSATFAVGTAGSFTLTTTGRPATTGITRISGVLPQGLTFTPTPLDGTTATISGTPAAGTAGTYTIQVRASNGFFTAATQTLTIQVNEAPAITAQPADATVAPGDTATFTAAASGTPTPTVQWQSNSGSGFLDIPGATSGTYSVATIEADNGTTFRAVFTNAAGSTPTGAATLHVGTVPSFSGPTSATFTVGTAGSLTITSDGTPAAVLSVDSSTPLPSWLIFTPGRTEAGTGGGTPPLLLRAAVAGGDPGTATLSGTPPAGSAGSYPVKVVATNGIGAPVSETVTIVVKAAAGPVGPGTGGNPGNGGGTPGGGTPGSGNGSGSGGSGGAVNPATGVLAFTGSLVNPYVALGGTLVLVLGGLALLLVRRRRQLGDTTDSD